MVDREELEYGILTPAGNVHWGEFRGSPMSTPEERAVLVLRLRKTAEDVDFGEAAYLDLHRWVTRTCIYNDDTFYSITDPAVAPPLSQQGA